MHTDVLIIGAGAAGMMCAFQAGRRGRSVLVLDHAPKLGGKILISGGGRCNFTNTGAGPANYVSRNPHFCKSALSRYTAADFIELVRSHGIAFHEKKLGQLFCDESARAIVGLLKAECDQAGVRFELGCRIESVARQSGSGPGRFEVASTAGRFTTESLVIATGGLSLPKLGATGFGHELARQFGLKVVETAPALDGFVFAGSESAFFARLAGLSIDCVISCGGLSFRENILFTHSGLSGPAALQASLHWRAGEPVVIDLLPGHATLDWLFVKKREGNRSILKNLLAELLPARFAEAYCERNRVSGLPLPQVSGAALEALCVALHAWELRPAGTVGYSKAEVTRGGVDTDELSSKTMEARKAPGLYFVGEVMDVTGWLGGYNFQWAWSSGWAAGQAV
ncbi:MAG: NAD(P)/FAD-dependent oxidoreductase [Oligoflexia bacterium]|nr:NAD(P)/FAD-dependent oxidoreductase [Oligoflexia bacterium]